MPDALNVLMRWLHITSVVVLIGGMLYARLIVFPALSSLSADQQETIWERSAAAFRALVYGAMTALVISGLYNLLTTPGHTRRYHMMLGIKLLLVLHVFAVAILVVQPNRPRRVRMMAGTAISGLVIIAISAYLRRIF
jgi:uncharacterized membrane protein